jgi:hypothetical protein
MKCIRNLNTGEIRRVPDIIADQHTQISPHLWGFCDKQAWKQSLKPATRTVPDSRLIPGIDNFFGGKTPLPPMNPEVPVSKSTKKPNRKSTK